MKPDIKKQEKNYSVPNLERALFIIELLTEHPQGLTLAQIQEFSDFPKSSIFRITQTLIDRDYIVKHEQPAVLTLSKKLLHIGLSTLSESSLVENSLTHMRQLRDLTKETVLLGSLDGSEGVLLEQVGGLHPFSFTLKLGKRFQLHVSAPSKAILAFLPEDEVNTLIETIDFIKYNENTITTKKAYLEELKKVRDCGYGIDGSEELEGVHCVAAPIFNQYGYPISAIWITAPSSRLPQEKFIEVGGLVKESAFAISKQFGYKR